MDRKGIVAVTVSFIVLVAWWYYNNQEMQKLAAARAAQAKAAEVEKAATPAPAAPSAPAPAVASGTPKTPEQTEKLETESVEYTFTSYGGGIAKALLKKHEAERGTRMVINEFGAIPIGAIDVLPGQVPEAPYSLSVDRAAGTVSFESKDSGSLHLTKTFAVPQASTFDKDYIVTMRVTYENRGTETVALPTYFVQTGCAAPVHARDRVDYTGFKWPGAKMVDSTWFNGSWFKQAQSTYSASGNAIPWAAVADQYFTTIVAPIVETPDAQGADKIRGNSVWATRFAITDTEWSETNHETSGSSGTRYGVEGALGMPGFTLKPGEKFSQSFRIYAGPREYGRLRLMPDGEESVLAFSDVGGIFSFLGPFVGFFSKVLLWSLNSIHAYVGSYALAIIILTVCIKALLWPMQNKATQSAKKMQALQPRLTELREKYEQDPTRMNTEMMKLYKDYGVNPLGGCLPAFIQMPIFFGFYNMLGKAIELRNSKFLWVHDLSQPDTLFHAFGFPVNILPLFMAGTMVWQMSATPKTGDPAQQRMFMIMPLIFVMFCYNYASALALYLTVQNLISVVQLYVTRNQAPPTLQKVSAPPKRKK